MNSPMVTFTKNDGILSLMHCQEWIFNHFEWTIWYNFILKHDFSIILPNRCKNVLKFNQKFKCESLSECVAYTFQQSRLICTLHSSIAKGLRYTRGKQTGMKKPDYILSLPEMSICFEQNRKKRCKREPKCPHINCLRNALEHFLDQVVSGKSHIIKLRKVKMVMMLGLSRTNTSVMLINANVHKLIKQ